MSSSASESFRGQRQQQQGHHAEVATTATGGASAAGPPSFESLGIRNTTVREEPGVQLSARQKLVVGSVLDLFEGNPTLAHFTLWRPDATFSDPITVAEGEARYKAQWYGLPTLFHPIAIRSHLVTSAGNPIEVQLSNTYTVRGLGAEQVVQSTVRIFLEEEEEGEEKKEDGGGRGRITRVEDRWGGKLPEGPVATAFRKLNAVTVPAFVRVPGTEEEDGKMRGEREGKGR